ncbi:MAG TPA: VOC family protein [Chloroflexia bacterium]|jgi:predicted enzyme related to lactoylglutathione lyase
MEDPLSEPLFKKVDCLRIPVPDLDAGLTFYRDRLGHELIWRDKTAAGLRMPETDTEIVIQTETAAFEIDLLVSSADRAAEAIVVAGGRVVVPPFDIQIGRCVVVQDPWNNQLVLLDMSKGPLQTGAEGIVINEAGTKPSE